MNETSCPKCDKEVLDVRGPYDSAKDGYTSFKTYVHEYDTIGPFREITESCHEDIE